MLECFNALTCLARGRVEDGKLDILGFQPRLLQAISGLEGEYRKIRQEEKRLIRRKANLNAAWFRRRMGLLAKYRAALAEVLGIARAIGDGFAWLFYENDRDLVVEHLKMQPQQLLPPDLGGIGERLILENMRSMGGKLLLYHGITSFLRIGDITLIDAETMKVACIGEIKTERADKGSVRVSLSMISDSAEGLPRFPETAIDAHTLPSEMELPPAMAARLDRQKKRMEEAIHRAAAVSVPRIEMPALNFLFEALSDLCRRAHDRRFEWESVGLGHTLGAARLRGVQSLSDVLLSNRKVQSARLTAGVEEIAKAVMLKGSKDNSLLLGNIGGKSEYFRVREEVVPFVLWRLDEGVLRDILFRRIAVLSIFNPAHLWEAIRERGYEVEIDGKGKFKSARRREGNRERGLDNIGYFVSLIHDALVSEEDVLKMIDRMSEMVDDRAPEEGGLRIELKPRIFHFPRSR